MSRKRHAQRTERHGYFTEGKMKIEDELKKKHSEEIEEELNH